jgi:acetyl esterase/lipase
MPDSREVLTRPAPPPDLTLAYGPHPDHVIDVRLPASHPAPLVVMIHGGFWRAAYDRTHTGPLTSALAAAGYVVAIPEFRRTGQEGGGWPGTFDDVAAALDAVPALLAPYSEEPPVLLGHSAGGHLAVWAATQVSALAASPQNPSPSNASRRLDAGSSYAASSYADGPAASRPATGGPGLSGLGTNDPGVGRADVSGLSARGPGGGRSDASQWGVSHADAGRTETGQSETSRSETSGPDGGGLDADHSDAGHLGTSRPSTASPATASPVTTPSATARPDTVARIKAVVSLAGCVDLAMCSALGLDDGATDLLLGGPPSDVPDRYALADPNRLPRPDVPVTLLHGTTDDRVPIEVSRSYAERTGVPLRELPSVGHFALIDPLTEAWPHVLAALSQR